MPYKPKEIWKRMPEKLQNKIKEEISFILEEVIDEYKRTYNPRTFSPQGNCLYSTVEPTTGSYKSRKQNALICPKRARSKSRVAA